MTSELAWFKSSYSGAEGGQCLEVALEWHKSSHSGAEGGSFQLPQIKFKDGRPVVAPR